MCTASSSYYHMLRAMFALRSLDFVLFFFFFQAEDGIRDTSVTGVQTCALPIYDCQSSEDVIADLHEDFSVERQIYFGSRAEANHSKTFAFLEFVTDLRPGNNTRSEERRVGKE